RDLRTLPADQLGVSGVFPLLPSASAAPFYYFNGVPFLGGTIDLGTLHFAIDTITAASPGTIDIEGHGTGDVILSGAIRGAGGTIAVSAEGGNIVEGGRDLGGGLVLPGGFLEASAIALHAGGAIFSGAPSAVILVQLDEVNNQEPTLTASAG